MRVGKTPLTMRVTDKGKRILEALAERAGISQTAVIEQLVRAEAERIGLTIDDKNGKDSDTDETE